MFKYALLFLMCLMTFSAQAFELNFNKLIDTVKKTKQATHTVEEPEEIQIGDGVAENMLGASALLPDNAVQEYINRIGRWVSLHTERPDLPWKFGVLSSDDINAFAMPGGTIFITRGLLLKLSNESELAGVLAHEISHVLRRHHLAALQKSARVGLAGDLAGHLLKEKGNRAITDKVIKAGTEVYARGLDKEDEFEADRMGVVIATRAGYDPYGLPAVLQILNASNAKDSSLALMFKTHPAPQDRLDRLDKLMDKQFDVYAAPEQTDERFSKQVLQH